MAHQSAPATTSSELRRAAAAAAACWRSVARSLPTADGDVVLREMEFVGEPSVRRGLVDRIEIFALDVFDQRDLEQRFARRSRDVT